MKTKEEIKEQLWDSFLIGLTDTLIEKNTTYKVIVEVIIKPETGLDLIQITTWVNELIEEHENELENNGN